MSDLLDNLVFIGKADVTVAEALRQVKTLERENARLRAELAKYRVTQPLHGRVDDRHPNSAEGEG